VAEGTMMVLREGSGGYRGTFRARICSASGGRQFVGLGCIQGEHMGFRGQDELSMAMASHRRLPCKRRVSPFQDCSCGGSVRPRMPLKPREERSQISVSQHANCRNWRWLHRLAMLAWFAGRDDRNKNSFKKSLAVTIHTANI